MHRTLLIEGTHLAQRNRVAQCRSNRSDLSANNYIKVEKESTIIKIGHQNTPIHVEGCK